MDLVQTGVAKPQLDLPGRHACLHQQAPGDDAVLAASERRDGLIYG
jgi:hypothetical protein